MDTTEELYGYFYAGMPNLSAGELFFWIFLEEAQEQLSTKDVFSLGLIIAGLPLLHTRVKFAGATPNTSLLSVTARHYINIQLKRKLPTLTWGSMKRMKFSYVKNLGAFVGRWVPFLGVFILLYDITIITKKTISRYNLIVKPEHRLYD